MQEGDEFKVVPGSEFVVSRTARKDNSSDYHVNGRKVPFKEVARLLKDCGIDLDHNRFLILQVSCVSSWMQGEQAKRGSIIFKRLTVYQLKSYMHSFALFE